MIDLPIIGGDLLSVQMAFPWHLLPQKNKILILYRFISGVFKCPENTNRKKLSILESAYTFEHCCSESTIFHTKNGFNFDCTLLAFRKCLCPFRDSILNPHYPDRK